MVENGGKHPPGSKALLYLPREVGGRGLKSIENEYKLTKIKTAVNLCQNQDSTMKETLRKGGRRISITHCLKMRSSMKMS